MNTTASLNSATLTITTTRTKFTDVPAPIPSHIRIETRTRKPESRAYTIDVPATLWPNTDDVPTIYRALVDSALLDCAETALNTFITSKASAGNPNMPLGLLTLENLLSATAARRMTSALLLGMWRNSSKYILEVAPKLTEYAGLQLLKYKANIERHEKRLTSLCARNPESLLSASDLDKLLVNLADADELTPFGDYLAARTEEIRSKITEDSEAL